MTAHPAKFTDVILKRVGELLASRRDNDTPELVLDPFAGTGKIHKLDGITTIGVEIEPEWATMHPRTIVANTLYLPFRTNTFDGIITSPCLAQDQRILTNDLTWVVAGDIQEGDDLLAFDESPFNPVWRGTASRRRWRRATVVRSCPRAVDCVRVILEDGVEVITTPEHPWLAYRKDRHQRADWIPSTDLTACWVMRQCSPWVPRTGYSAGWLAGMFDGEGSLSLGRHGAPKLCIYQAEGPVADAAEELMWRFGYEPNRIVRKGTPDHCRKVANLYVTGGFPAMLRALGELRPIRLLTRWRELDVTTRTLQADKVKVLAVEPAGRRDIQQIETSSGTYIGEGYLMHNCYGNRHADHHKAKDASYRHSYTHTLGHDLHDDSAGTLHWGPAYRAFHDRAWTECLRVLRPGGFVMINVSNHIRRGQEQPVVEWHLGWFLDHDCKFIELEQVETPRLRAGANSAARVSHEVVFHVAYQPAQEVAA